MVIYLYFCYIFFNLLYIFLIFLYKYLLSKKNNQICKIISGYLGIVLLNWNCETCVLIKKCELAININLFENNILFSYFNVIILIKNNSDILFQYIRIKTS